MNAHRAVHRITTMCRVQGVSPSGYHAWRRREPSRRSRADAELSGRIEAIHARSRGTYGAPRVEAELAAGGTLVGRKRVARLMRERSLEGASRRRGIRTTRRSEHRRPAADLVDRDFTAEGPERLWVADITYVPTWAGFLFLAVVVPGAGVWSAGRWRRTCAPSWFSTPSRWLWHSADRPMSSTTPTRAPSTPRFAFGQRCRQAGVRPSMGSVGDCFDNALCESFFATLECELLDRRPFPSQTEARMAVFEFLEGWYNPHRRHSALGYLSPAEFEWRRREDEELDEAAAAASPRWRCSLTLPAPHPPALTEENQLKPVTVPGTGASPG